jgi:hypothetical protein
MSSNPYSSTFTPDVRGFFQVGEEGERTLIDAARVTRIDENDEETTTIYYQEGAEEDYVEVSEKYNDVIAKFAKARNG